MGRSFRFARVQALGMAIAVLAALPSPAAAQVVQITGLSDVAFGTVASVTADRTSAQSVCAVSGVLGGRYTVSASGSGTGGAFTLNNGAALLPFDVQWSGTSGQSSGTQLSPNTPLAATATLLNCLLANDASLIVILRGTSLSAATAGSYSGTLTIILAAN